MSSTSEINYQSCTLCHTPITGKLKKSTNKQWSYHPECYSQIRDRPIEWYKERTKTTKAWDYLFPEIDPYRKLHKR